MKSFLFLSFLLVQTVLISARVGRKCTENKICRGPYEECSKEGNCICKSIAAEVDKVCYLYASELNGYFCQYSEQCGQIPDDSAWINKHAQCDEQRKLCKCNDAQWTITNNNCLKKEPQCAETKDCKEYEICFDNECIPRASKSNGYACEHTEQCEHIPDDSSLIFFKHAKCTDNQCSCNTKGWTIEDEKCVKGEVECKYNKDCKDDSKLCVHNKCLAKSSEENKYTCTDNQQCRHIKDTSGTIWAQFAICDAKQEKCTCHQDKWNIKNNECIKTVECTDNADCGDEVSCVKNQCKKQTSGKSSPGYVLSISGNVEIKLVQF